MTSAKKKASKIPTLSAVNALIAEARKTPLSPIPYRSMEPDDEPVGKVSAATLQLGAFVHELKKQMAAAEAASRFIYDEEQFTQHVIRMRILQVKLAAAEANFTLQLFTEAKAWEHPQPTIRAGGVVVFTPMAERRQDSIFEHALTHAGISAYRSLGGGSYEEVAEERTVMDLAELEHMLEGSGLLDGVVGLLRDTNANIERSRAETGFSRANGHDHGEQPGAGH